MAQQRNFDADHADAIAEHHRRTPGIKARVARARAALKPPGKKKAISRTEAAKRRKDHAKRYVSFFDPHGKEVTVDLQSNPLIGIYRSGGIDAPQFAAAGQFQRDYDASSYSGMKCRGFEPGVDGGQAASGNLAAIAAQRTLSKMKLSLGEENYALLIAVIGMRLTFSHIHAAGGDENKVISMKLRVALNKAATFYEYQRVEPESRTLKALQKLLSGMAGAAGEFTT